MLSTLQIKATPTSERKFRVSSSRTPSTLEIKATTIPDYSRLSPKPRNEKLAEFIRNNVFYENFQYDAEYSEWWAPANQPARLALRNKKKAKEEVKPERYYRLSSSGLSIARTVARQMWPTLYFDLSSRTSHTLFEAKVINTIISQLDGPAIPEEVHNDLKEADGCLSYSRKYQNAGDERSMHRLSLLYALERDESEYDTFCEDVRHTVCGDNKGCFNPYHLLPGTHRENMKDKGRTRDELNELRKQFWGLEDPRT